MYKKFIVFAFLLANAQGFMASATPVKSAKAAEQVSDQRLSTPPGPRLPAFPPAIYLQKSPPNGINPKSIGSPACVRYNNLKKH